MAPPKMFPQYLKEIPIGKSIEQRKELITKYEGRTMFIKDFHYGEGYMLATIEGIDKTHKDCYIVETPDKDKKRLCLDDLEGLLDPIIPFVI